MEHDAMTMPIEETAVVQKKRGAVRRIVGTLLYLVFIFGIVVGLPKFLSWSLATQYPMAAITSGSMWPALQTGDLIFIHGIRDKSEISIGDIVVYKNLANGLFTIHRVVKLGAKTFTTKGDANFNEDAPVSYDQIVGRTMSLFGGGPVRIPYLGSITIQTNKLRNEPQ